MFCTSFARILHEFARAKEFGTSFARIARVLHSFCMSVARILHEFGTSFARVLHALSLTGRLTYEISLELKSR